MAHAGACLVYLIQQGVWDMPLESMPLASGYIAAAALADDRISREAEIQIRNFRGGAPLSSMASQLFAERTPDVIGFSVLGWNYRAFGALAETFKQLNPNGLVVFGGTHVAGQAERTFRMFPDVDVVVNGEGELVFRDLLSARLDGVSGHDLGHISGLSFRRNDGSIQTTAPRPRIANLDDIPSPFLTGAIGMLDDAGRFRYDVALMESSRGCPYRCAFCYWGGAVGQKVHAFSRARLRAELEFFAKLRVHTIVLCDANFGLLPGDATFVDDIIEIRERYGFPRALETSWAKNKSRTFYDIVRKMKRAGLRSSFTLALQTLDDAALGLMNRRNMKVNEWEDLAAWLTREGLDCYAELIWGAPGETAESFMHGYDRLASKVSRIACYPMLLLPNTDYTEKKRDHGIVSVRGDNDDFEYVLRNNTVGFAENKEMQRFLLWARVMAEMAVLRFAWIGLRELAGITQSRVLRNLAGWIEHGGDPAAEPLRAAMGGAIGGAGDLVTAITYLYTDPESKRMLELWWARSMRPLLQDQVRPVLDEVFRFDLLTQPVCVGPDGKLPGDLAISTVDGEEYYLREGVRLRYDVPAIVARLRAGQPADLAPRDTNLDLYYRIGAESAVRSTNHESIVHYMGMTRDQVMTRPADGDGLAGSLLGNRGGCS